MISRFIYNNFRKSIFISVLIGLVGGLSTSYMLHIKLRFFGATFVSIKTILYTWTMPAVLIAGFLICCCLLVYVFSFKGISGEAGELTKHEDE